MDQDAPRIQGTQEVSMTRTGTVASVAVALLAGGAAAAERPVQMKDLPPAVQQTVLKETKGLAVVGLSVETENGRTLYEAETRVEGHTRDILIDASGTVVEKEEEVPLAGVPEPARAAIQRAAGGDTVERVEAVTKDGVTEYEAVVKKGGKKSEIVVSSDGTLQKH